MLCWIVLNACKFLFLGGQQRHGEIFSKKRHKLHKWVVETSNPYIEGLCSKGLDAWPFNKFSHFILASYHGLVEIFLGMILFLCFSIACSPRATKTAYVPFPFHMVLVIKLNNYFSGRVLRNQNQGKFILIPNLSFSLLWSCIVSSKN